ncbi:MAG: hypothetical protein QXM75_03265 [Candidatus Diapherotrites archaeon]
MPKRRLNNPRPNRFDPKKIREWLNKTGVTRDIERHAKKVAARPKINLQNMKNPVEGVANLILAQGIKWPIEREIAKPKRPGEYFYDTSLVRNDLRRIRLFVRTALEEVPPKERAQFLRNLRDFAKVQHIKEKELYASAKIPRDATLHERRANILIGIANVCERMLRFFSKA